MLNKNLLFFFAISALIIACGPSSSDQIAANKDLIKRFTVALNSAEWDAFDDLLTEDFQRHSQANPDVKVKSRDQYKILQQDFLASMPDQKIVNQMLIAEGNFVATYSIYTGTLTGPMGNFPATGKSLEMKFLSIFRIENNRIAEVWVEWDNINMLTQLCIFHPPPPEK